MLNKEVCKQCKKKYDYFQRWIKADDDFWDKYHCVKCPKSFTGTVLVQIGTKDCPYKLEHMVMEQDDKQRDMQEML